MEENREWLKFGACALVAGLVGALFGEKTVFTLILGYCLYMILIVKKP